MDARLRWAGVRNDGWENDGSAHKQAYAPLLTYTHIRTALRDLAVMLLSSDLQRYNRLKQITKQLGIIGLYVACWVALLSTLNWFGSFMTRRGDETPLYR